MNTKNSQVIQNSSRILDCTLRDGGYYNDWDFDDDMIRKYLSASCIAKIDIIEIGFRSFPKNKFLGALAFSSDNYLLALPLPLNVEVAVMVNAKELLDYELGVDKAIDKLFVAKKNSPVDIVRVATHCSDVDKTYSIVEKLKKLGYRVFLNLMQVDSLEPDAISNIAGIVNDWGFVEVLYFADSFGNMDPYSVISTVKAIKKNWKFSIGIHAHDNKGHALTNSIAALESGVDYIDSTILGMGRGAGNTKTENLLIEMTQRDYGVYYPDAIFPLVLHEFKNLHNRYKWGTNIYYYLSAEHGIHPTYIQEMLGDDRYDTEHILAAINFLKSTRAPFYNFENLLRAISGVKGNEHGEWSASEWVHGKDVLIIGSGPGTKKYINALKQYININNPIVLCLNINEDVPEEIVSAYVACHEIRILIESDHYSKLTKPLILPLCRVPEAIKETFTKANILDFGLRVEQNNFEIYKNGCVISSPLALLYAISVANAGGASKILLAGMDGYQSEEPRQIEMVGLLNMYAEKDDVCPIHAITPTTYPVFKDSVYNL